MVMLNPAPGFEVDIDDFAPATTAIIGKKRTGKSNIAGVLLELMFDIGVHWVLVDPKGDSFGMRSSADGTGPGIAVLILGGLHADVPIDETMGAFVANLVYDQELTCIIDVSRMATMGYDAFNRVINPRAQFLTAFAKQLYRRHQESKRNIMVVVDEAQNVVPESGTAEPGMASSVAAWSEVVSMGGGFGLGVILISQRAQSISKKVLSQIEMLIITRTVAETDRKPLIGWMESKAVQQRVGPTLPMLANGEAWVLSPYLGLDVRAQFPMRRTFDSGSTPKVGEKQRAPQSLASINLGGLRAAIEENQSGRAIDDPNDTEQVASLKARIRELESGAAVPTAPPPNVKEVEVERIVEVDRIPTWLEGATDLMRGRADHLARLVGEMVEHTESVQLRILEESQTAPTAAPGASYEEFTERAAAQAAASRRAAVDAGPEVPRPAPALPTTARGKILAVLVRHPEGRTIKQLGFQSGVKPGGSTMREVLANLRKDGHINLRGQPIMLTEAGRAMAPPAPPIPTGGELLDHWRSELGRGIALTLFNVIVTAWPTVLTQEQMSERAEALTGKPLQPGGSTMREGLATLRKLELVVGNGANPDMMAAAGY